MQSGVWTLLGLLVTLSVTGSCTGLECYLCAGGNECGDSFDTTNAFTQPCSSNEMCAIVVRGGNISRGCLPPENCQFTGFCTNELCLSCCDTDRCNDGPAPQPPDDSLNCYQCSYRSDTGVSSACKADPFVPGSSGVSQVSCSGKCVVGNMSDSGVTTIFRTCSPPTGQLRCIPGCYPAPANGCFSCCSDNLCNDGSIPSPEDFSPPTQPPPAPSPTGKGTALAPDLKPVMFLIVALATSLAM